MKKLILFSIFFILLSSIVFGATGTSSDSVITDKSSTGAAAVAASSSDSLISSTVSAAGSAIATAYSSSDGLISGNPGFPVTDTVAATPATTTTPTASTESSSIPSSGGSSGPTTESAETTTEAAETTAEATTEAVEPAAEATPEPVVGQALLAPIEVSATLETGQSLALSPSLVSDASASLFVTEVTETTVTLQIDTESGVGDMITGGVVADLGEIVVLTIGESVELDTNKDGKVDIKLTVDDIKFEDGEYKAYFDIVYYMNDAETKQFVQEQLESGEVRYPVERTWVGMGVILGITILFAATIIIKIMQEKKRRKYW